MTKNIMSYESDIWATADLLRGAGIKTSDFPKYMMPFFALIMVESRLLRLKEEKEEEFDKEELEEMLAEIQDEAHGYNDKLLREGKSLQQISKNDKTFRVDFTAYLRAFDAETQHLLGVEKGNTEEKFLDISGISGLLSKKNILLATVKAWAGIDLKPFTNSEITTLEEHIKRRWADISAETAGEQYTPDDVISLIGEIIVSKQKPSQDFITIYDPTCGGGNMLFGVEDKINEKFPTRPTKTFGEDWNDALYALAKIESRFRQDSTIKHGNTLTDLKFSEKQFNIVVANPPYGVDWKGFQKDIRADKTGRFIDYPSVSDGQLLFTQHIIHHIAAKGMAIVVHNGSTLFSGDAGSGESNIRKHFFEKDLVEAIIQLPTDEFFNTNIYTYLWIFNKNKTAERKNKVMLINASEHYQLLKKNKGKKRKEIDTSSQTEIVATLNNFKNTDFAKVFDTEYFFFNKQAILLQNLDEDGQSFQKHLPWKTNRTGEKKQAKSIKFKPLHIQQGELIFTKMDITDFDTSQYPDLKTYYNEGLKPLVNSLDYKEKDLVITAFKDKKYWFDKDKNTIVEALKGKETTKGCGKILVKASYKKATKTKGERIELRVELTADNQKDYEVIPYSRDPEKNQQNIENFMAKYITKPFEYLDKVVGVEINFNKVFYQPEVLRPIGTILGELADLEKDLKLLENDLQL